MNDNLWTVAVCCRGQDVAIAVFAGAAFKDVTQHRDPYPYRRLERLLGDVVLRTGATLVVIEPGSVLDRRRSKLGTATQTLTVAAAKELLLPGRRQTQQDLYEHLVERIPALRQLVDRTATGTVARVQTWNTVALSAVALGLAAARRRDLHAKDT